MLAEGQGCAYSRFSKCDSCDYVVYRKCPTFRLWRAKYLLRDILPITLTESDQKYYGRLGECYYISDLTKAKKFVASTAIKLDKSVKMLTLNQALSIVLDQQEVEGKVFLIVGSPRPGDKDKIQSCVESLVDRMLLDQ